MVTLLASCNGRGAGGEGLRAAMGGEYGGAARPDACEPLPEGRVLEADVPAPLAHGVSAHRIQQQLHRFYEEEHEDLGLRERGAGGCCRAARVGGAGAALTRARIKNGGKAKRRL